MHYDVGQISMQGLAKKLSNCLGRGVHRVVDETGIVGDFHLAWDCPLVPPRQGVSDAESGPLSGDLEYLSPLTRSLDTIGLKLEKRKTLLSVYVIDKIERPATPD